MKFFFIPAKYNANFSLEKLKSLGSKKFGLITTIQFVDLIPKIKKILNIVTSKAPGLNEAQILGCNPLAGVQIESKVDAFLYIGSGKFHVYGLALKTKKPIFIFNPLTNQLSEFDRKELDKLEKRKKAQEIKFLSAEKLGVLVSIKPGQCNLRKALEIKKKKYVFLFDNLDSNQFENFPEIDCWVNTACPGLFYDFNVYNY
ncbi:MAG: diphthamide synthesis protein [archaeon]